MYINTQTQQYPVTENAIREAFSNVSFPVPFVAPEEYAVVFRAPWPEYNPISQSVREAVPELTSKGFWEQRWIVVDLPLEQAQANAVTAAAERLALTQAMRAEAYRTESDPLFFKSQRGEATQQEWLDKVAEIKARYPA